MSTQRGKKIASNSSKKEISPASEKDVNVASTNGLIGTLLSPCATENSYSLLDEEHKLTSVKTTEELSTKKGKSKTNSPLLRKEECDKSRAASSAEEISLLAEPEGNVSPLRRRRNPVGDVDKPHIPYSIPWKWGLENGLINPSRTNGREYYHIIHRRFLDLYIEEYKAGNDVVKRKVRAKMENYILDELRKRDQDQEPTINGSNSHVNFHTGTSTHNSGSFPRGNAFFSGDGDLPPLPHMPLWKEGMELGLIGERCYFHRNIPGFITPSELRMLLDQYKAASSGIKAEMRDTFEENVSSYNSSIPKTLGCLRVYTTYASAWDMALKEGLVTPEIEYKAEYAEWVAAKELIGYVQTVVSLGRSSERQAVRDVIAKSLQLKLSQASKILRNRVRYNSMDFLELLQLTVEYAPYETKQPFATCPTCPQHLDRADVIAALTSWRSLSEEEEKSRYKRWYEYRKYTHAQKCDKGSKLV